MYKKAGLSALALVALLATSQAQEKDKIKGDRPGESQSAEVLKKGFLQAEAGFRKEQQNDADYLLHHPTSVIKYSLSDRFELRAALQAETQKFKSTKDFRYGLKPVELGFKANILEGKGAVPKTSLLTQVGIPTLASADHKTPHAFPRVRMLFENELTQKTKLGYNIGAEWDGESTSPQWIYTLAPEFELGEKWDAFIEEFAWLQKGAQPQHSLDGGFAYYAGSNVKLDLWGGVGLSKAAPDYFIATGVSFRLKP